MCLVGKSANIFFVIVLELMQQRIGGLLLGFCDTEKKLLRAITNDLGHVIFRIIIVHNFLELNSILTTR